MKKIISLIACLMLTSVAYADTCATNLIPVFTSYQATKMCDSFVSTLATLEPDTDDSYDLGSSSKRWRDLYLSGQIIDSAAPSATPASVSVFGNTAVNADVTTIASLSAFVTGVNEVPISFVTYGNASQATNLQFLKTRSTSATGDANTIVQSGDRVADIVFRGADGASYVDAARIRVTVDGTPGSNDMPGAISFDVSPDGSGTAASALLLSNTKLATFAGQIQQGAGLGQIMVPYVPTMAATPVAGTNVIQPGYNVVPTAAANTAALLPATPTPGQQFHIYNEGANSVRIKAGGASTMNGATAGGYIVLATKTSLECKASAAANYECFLPANPTPAGP
jgi:hypothetical protein